MKRKLFLLLYALLTMIGVQAREDVTSTYLTNAGLSSLEGWTIDKDHPGDEAWNGYTAHNKDGAVNVIEFYYKWAAQGGGAIGSTRTFDFSQVANLPQGYYRLKVNGFYREGNNNPTTNQQKAYIYAGSKTQYLEGFAGFHTGSGGDIARAASDFSNGYYENSFDFDMDEAGEIQIGFHGDINTYCSWCIIGPVTLYKYEISDFTEEFNEKKGQAEALYSVPMNSDVLVALQAAANVDQSSWTTKEQIADATSALNTALANANTSIANYHEAFTITNAASVLDEAGRALYLANESVIAIKDAYDGRTLVSVSSDQKTACDEALRAAAKAQTTAGSDMTFAIVNWDFLNCQHNNFPGWTIEAVAGSNTWENGDTRVEYWKPKAADGRFDYYQTITGLPNGKYTLSASMWNSTNGENPAPAGVNGQAGVYAASGEHNVFAGVTDDCDGDHLHTYSTGEVTVANGTLRLGVKNNETMGGRWFGVDWIHMTYVRALTPTEEAEEQYNDALGAAQKAKTAVGTNYGGVFQHTTITYNALVNAINTYGDVSGDADTYIEAKNALNSALTDFNNSVNLPDENKVYRMLLANNGVSTGLNLNATDAEERQVTITSDLYAVHFVVSARGANYYNIKSADDKTLSCNKSNWDVKYYESDARGADMSFVINDNGTVQFSGYMTSLQSNPMGLLNATPAEGTGVSMRPGSVVLDQWLVVEFAAANLKVVDGKMGTFIAPFDIELPANVKAYSAVSNKSQVTLTKVAEGGEILAAGTPVIVYGDGVSVDKIFFGAPAVTENQTEGNLVGILDAENRSVPLSAYVLQTQGGNQAFYRLETAATGTLNRCYVTANDNADARLIINFPENPTGISIIEAADAEAEGGLKDGKYLIGNKVVLVKNGVKYGANGQILK